MSVRTAGRGGKSVEDHIGPESADDAHYIGKNLLAVPDIERLAIIFGETEVDGAREKLFRAIHAPRLQQFVRPNHAQFRALFRTDQILAAIAARDREVSGAQRPSAGQESQQPVIFVIGMSADVKDAARFAKIAQLKEYIGGGHSLLVGGQRLRNRRRHAGQRDQQRPLPPILRRRPGAPVPRIHCYCRLEIRSSSILTIELKPSVFLARSMDSLAAAIAPGLSP